MTQVMENASLAKVVGGTDLAPNVYEGGFKLWECSIDLCDYLAAEHAALGRTAHEAAPTSRPTVSTLTAGCSAAGHSHLACFTERPRNARCSSCMSVYACCRAGARSS